MNRKKIVIMGPVPPPFGGVSIHIWRLSHLLAQDFDFSFVDEAREKKEHYFNFREFRPDKYLKEIWKSDLLLIHSGTNSLRFFHIIFGKLFARKIVLTVHAYPADKKPVPAAIDRFFYGLCDQIIAVNPDISKRIGLPLKTIIRHAFLPPILEEEQALPTGLRDFINRQKAAGRFLICANASRLDRFNNQDVYGLDMCIELAALLKEKGIPATLVFNVAEIDKYEADYKRYEARIAQLKLEDTIRLISQKLSFVRLMEESDLVLRPTNTDGDALTVREGLMLKKPVIASDVVTRPEGTILFRTRDVYDLENKVVHTIQNYTAALQNMEYAPQAADYAFYRDLFNSLFERGSMAFT